MRLCRPSLSGLCTALPFLLTSMAGAEPENREPLVLWYRSSEGCPDGASFLATLGDRAPLFRLAQAGDRVDFVVNLAKTQNGARGRLERETDAGTVAIREVEDTSCERVAEVVALNLSLALDPSEQAAPQPEEEQVASEEGAAAVNSEATPAATHTAKKPDEPAKNPPKKTREGQTPAQGPASAKFRAGLQGGAQSGVTPLALARAAIFVEAKGLIESAPALTLRVAGVGAVGAVNTDIGKIQHALWAGRLEVCPVSIGPETLTLSPCVAGELGQLQAEGPLSDSALWGALGAHARGIWNLARPFSLEADVGTYFPLYRYEVAADSDSLYRSAPVGAFLVLGAALTF